MPVLAVVWPSCSSSSGSDGPESSAPKDIIHSTYVELSNKQLTVRQALNRGGAICYIAKAGTSTNIVNVADEGRYIQQSYYAGRRIDRRSQGQGSAWSPWNWNPIQVGDYKRNRAQKLEATRQGNTTYVKVVPMLWDMDNSPAEAEMEQWTTLDGNTIHVRCRISCHRTDDIYGEGVMCDQEIPAVYPISSLYNLYTYNGDAPFTGDDISTVKVQELTMNASGGGGTWGRYADITEQWMAFVDGSGWGIGVYSPTATSFLAGRSDSFINGKSDSGSTSYIAPLRREALMKNSVMEYEYYLVIDHIDHIRSRIYELKGV